MSDDLVRQWDEYIESMGCVMGEVEHMAQKMRNRIEELEAKAIANRVAIMRLEAKLTKAVGALEGVDKFVRDLSPFADPSHSPATALARACEVYAKLTGGTDE